MDIWSWIGELADAGGAQGYLAYRAGWVLPGHVVGGGHDQVDAIAPGLLAEARAQGLPWLEVFIRHWHLHSRVEHRGEGRAALTDAVDALDRAHRANARGCPQAICTVQDLCITYANADGPGYAAERLAATAEALGSINVSWACFTCITAEQAGALRDAGLAEEALAFLDRQQAAMVVAGSPHADDDTCHERVLSLLGLGRAEEALATVEVAQARPNAGHGVTGDVRRRLDRALVLARLGRGDEAEGVLPAPGSCQPRERVQWAQTVVHLVELGTRPNDGTLGRLLRDWVTERLSVGAFDHALELAAMTVRLAAGRGSRWAATWGAARAATAAAGLREPGRAGALLQELAAIADGLEPPPIADAARPDDVVAHPGTDPEEQAGRLLTALERWPDDDGTAAAAARAIARAGDLPGAEELLLGHVRSHPHDGAPAHLLGELALAGAPGRAEAVVLVFDELGLRVPAAFLRARLAWREHRYEDCCTWSATVVDLQPGARNTRRLWAQAAGRLGDFAAMLALLDEVIASHDPVSGEDIDPDHWDRMVAATALGRWDVVRASCAHLGIELETAEGPVEEVWHPATVRYDDGVEEWAERTGPVTARVLSVAPPGRVQRADDRIVFDPAPLVPAPEDEDEEWMPVYRHVVTLSLGSHVAYELVGVGFAREELDEVLHRLDEAGVRIRVAGRTFPTPDGVEIDGFDASLGIPPGVEPSAVHALLVELFGAEPDPARPVLWPLLARDAGAEPVAERHAAAWERWGF